MDELPFPVSKRVKIAPGSLLTEADQIALYAAEKGIETTTRQVRAARLERRACVCATQKITRRWDGMRTPTSRTVHEDTCPKYKAWMGEGKK